MQFFFACKFLLSRLKHVQIVNMFISLQKTFDLHCYVEGLVQVLLDAPSPFCPYNRFYNSNVVIYIDLEGEQG